LDEPYNLIITSTFTLSARVSSGMQVDIARIPGTTG
jgi:hypothetical protein